MNTTTLSMKFWDEDFIIDSLKKYPNLKSNTIRSKIMFLMQKINV